MYQNCSKSLFLKPFRSRPKGLCRSLFFWSIKSNFKKYEHLKEKGPQGNCKYKFFVTVYKCLPNWRNFILIKVLKIIFINLNKLLLRSLYFLKKNFFQKNFFLMLAKRFSFNLFWLNVLFFWTYFFVPSGMFFWFFLFGL